MKARRELLEEGLTSDQLTPIEGYVAAENGWSTVQALADERADHNRTKESIARLKRVSAALGVVSVFGAMGWMLAPSLTQRVLPTNTTGISEQDGTAVIGSIEASTFKVGNKTIYTKVTQGKCDVGERKIKMSKTQKVNWEWANGNISKKTVSKGKTVCKYVSKSGVTTEATYVNGVMTKLPKGFPKNPAVADIESLGLNPNSKVSPQLRIPQPIGNPLTVGSLPSTVKPVSVSRPYNVHQVNEWGDSSDTQMFNVTWNLTGGSGVVGSTKYDPTTNTYVQFYVPLNSNGVTQITSSEWSEGKETPIIQLNGRIQSNYGQASLPFSTMAPSSTSSGWEVPDVGTGPKRFGTPTGQNTNLYMEDNPDVDGYVLLDENFNMMMLDY